MASIIFPRVSAEITPRLDDRGLLRIEQTVKRALKFDPLFIDLSFAGGGRPDVGGEVRQAVRRTIAVIRGIAPNISIVPHITRTSLDIANIRTFLAELTDLGIYKFMLLGGDPPRDDVPRFPKEDCYATTPDMIEDVCGMFYRWGLANKLQLLVGVELEGHEPIKSTKAKMDAGTIHLLRENNILTVGEGVTQYYTKTGIFPQFLTDFKNQIDISIAAGITVGSGVPQPKPMIDPFTKQPRLRDDGNAVLIDCYGAILHPEYLQLFDGIDPEDKSEATRIRLAVTHKDIVCLSLVEELAKAGVSRIHGYTHNRTDLFDVLEEVYPGIASQPVQASRLQRPALGQSALC